MLRSTRELIGYRLIGADGDAGRVADVYVRDSAWTVRYVVATLGSWAGRRQVLVPPEVLGRPDWAARSWPLYVHRRDLEQLLPPDRDRPVSQQRSIELGWSNWIASWWSSGGGAVGEASLIPRPRRRGRVLRDWNSDPHLRSFKELAGYAVRAVDDVAGWVHDLILDDERWTVEALVVTVGRWLPRRRVMIDSGRAVAVSAEDAEVQVGMPEEQLLAAPVFRPGAPINRTAEDEAHDYHGRPTHSEWS